MSENTHVIPLYIQPPNRPDKSEYWGDADERCSWYSLARTLRISVNRIAYAKVLKRDGEKRWQVVIV